MVVRPTSEVGNVPEFGLVSLPLNYPSKFAIFESKFPSRWLNGHGKEIGLDIEARPRFRLDTLSELD